ncbi:MAG: hypothetical protein ABGX16_05680 [Pirellulales bacterium]
MNSFRSIAWLSLTICVFTATTATLSAAETAVDKRTFTASEQAARKIILDSAHWRETRAKFKQWLSVQSVYDSQQLVRQENDLKQHIGSLSAAELQQFLDAMDERLDVLLSPGMDQARTWVDHYYTEKAQRKMAKKLGVEQPLKMTGSQLTAALERFQEQRASASQSSAAFNRVRQSQTKSLNTYRAQERSAQAKSRSSQRSASFSKHAPVKKRQQQTRYPSSSYTNGWRGWGGW